MTTRRDFIAGAGAFAGAAFCGCGLLEHAYAQPAARRREVVVNGQRVKTVDVHAHCVFPEVMAMLDLKWRPPNLVVGADRFAAMDAQGIDMEAISINAFWYNDGTRRRREADQAAEREARRARRRASRPLRRLRHGRDAASRSGGRAARIRHQEARPARHVGRRQRRRDGARPIRSFIRSGRSARSWASSSSSIRSAPRSWLRGSRATAGSKTPSAIRSKPRSHCRI